jgi:hypothetical protein
MQALQNQHLAELKNQTAKLQMTPHLEREILQLTEIHLETLVQPILIPSASPIMQHQSKILAHLEINWQQIC